MKQQVNPLVFAACAAAIIGLLVLVGVYVFSPPPMAPAVKDNTPPRPATINGHPVPKDVPYSYMQQAPNGQNQTQPPK